MKTKIWFVTCIIAFSLNQFGLASEDGEEVWSAESRAITGGERHGFFYGLGVSISQTPYQDYDNQIIPLPMVGYMGERLRVFGPFVSYALVQMEGLEVIARIQPRFGGYREKDSPAFLGMAKRKLGLDAGLSLRYSANKWWVEFTGLRDALGRTDGYELSADMGYDYRFGPLTVSPRLGVSRQSRQLVDYYYGVRLNEVRVGRSQYDGISATNWRAGLSVGQPLLSGMVRLNLDQTWYGSAIKDSPLVDKGATFGALINYTRFF